MWIKKYKGTYYIAPPFLFFVAHRDCKSFQYYNNTIPKAARTAAATAAALQRVVRFNQASGGGTDGGGGWDRLITPTKRPV